MNGVIATDNPDSSAEVRSPAPEPPVAVILDDDAMSLARGAARLEAGGPDLVGDAVDTYAEDGVAVTVRFQAPLAGYRGWLWSVTMALLDAAHPTVSEVVLLPGPDALLAPAWVPWEQRIRSGDLGVGDLLPPAPDDPRLVPAYLQSDDPALEEVSWELGVGRVRVLSREGRVDAAERWHDGPFGPADEMAVHAPAHCATCAFYLPLAGSLGGGFGACGNEYSPADGRVVDAGYGCGAHSEAISARPPSASITDTVIDELRLEVHTRTADVVGPAGPAGISADDEGEGDVSSDLTGNGTDATGDHTADDGLERDETPVADPTGLHWPEDDEEAGEGQPVVLTPGATTAALAVEGVTDEVSEELDPDSDEDDEGGSSADLARQED